MYSEPSQTQYLPPALDNGARYDFVFVPPQPEEEEIIRRQVREAVGKYFHVTIAPEIRSMDVYVVTAQEGKTPPAKSESEAFAGGFSSSTRRFAVPEALRASGG